MKDVAFSVGVTTASVHGWINGDFKPSAKCVHTLKLIGFSDTACLEPSKDVEV